MAWRTAPERTLPSAAEELAAAFGDDLRTLALYGSAARAEARGARSDVNLVVVAEPLRFAHLGRVAQWRARWRGERFATPLLLSAADLERSRDVFPLELLDIQAHHRTLAGVELFAALTIPPAAVRAECEREAKGKLIRLRELYIELAGSTRDLRALMLDSRKTFLMVMRGLLHLRGEPWAGAAAAVPARFERAYACPLPVLAALDPADEDRPIEQEFAGYVADVERLAAIADAS